MFSKSMSRKSWFIFERFTHFNIFAMECYYIYSPISSKIQLLTCMATPEFFFVKGLGSEILCSFSPRCSNMTQILWLAPYSLNAAAFVKSSYYGGHSFYVYLTQLSIDSSHKIISNTTNSKNVNRRLTSLSCFL